ncbi:hypothetical protein H1R20_g7764, partial [Candolleomyces eurysporus]
MSFFGYVSILFPDTILPHLPGFLTSELIRRNRHPRGQRRSPTPSRDPSAGDAASPVSAGGNGRLSPGPGGDKKKPLYLCSPFADAALVKGNFKTIVMQPKYVDIMEWVAVNVYDFFTNLNEFYGVIAEKCTSQTCPTMSAGPSLNYLWTNRDGKQVSLPAPTYIDYVVTSVQQLIDDENVFPNNANHTFHPSFPSTVKSIYRQLLRVFAHLYHAHFDVILHLRAEPHFNSLFAHFLAFGKEYQLLEVRDIKGEVNSPTVGVGQLWESPFVDAALVKGNFKTIVMLPKYVDIMEWVAVNIFDFYTNLNEFYGVITDVCTQQTCPTMSAGHTLSYTWINQDRKSVHLPAPTYIDYVMTWVQNLLDDENSFPTKSGHDFPASFPSTVKHVYRQLLRVFAHIYHSHFQHLLHLRSEPHFNSLFAHFLAFGREYDLLEVKDLKGANAASAVGIGALWERWREMGILEG